MDVKQTVSMSSTVTVRLSQSGRRRLQDYIGRSLRRDRGVVPLPLWEAFKIFGPVIVSSVDLPFGEVSFMRRETAAEAHGDKLADDASRAERSLRDIGRVLGCDPAAWLDAHVPDAPDGEGWWWLDGEPTRVVCADDYLRISSGIHSGRRVDEFIGWDGQALKDPRLALARARADDMPF